MQEKYFKKKNPPNKEREKESERENILCEKIMNRMEKRIVKLQ